MILIGQYDSPFVRRVGIALTLYGMSFAHEPWSAFGDADKIARHNPLIRVPTLVLDDGTALTDSNIILSYLDGLVPAEQRLLPAAEPERRLAHQVTALATGAGDKAVSLFYERRLHREVSDIWVNRCLRQISGTLDALEADRAGRGGDYWFGGSIGHPDIAVAVVLRFIADALPGQISLADYPALSNHAARMEALPVFKAVSQPFIPPT